MPSVRPGSTPNTDKDAEHGCGRSEAIFSLKTIGGHAPADILAIRKAPAARRTAVALIRDVGGRPPAAVYGVTTFNLNKAVKRNTDRFPEDFMFQLTAEEGSILRFQIGMSKGKGRGSRRYLPYVFTEHGVAMLSSVLRSKRAVQVNVEIMRAFVRLRRMLASNEDLVRKLAALEKKYDAQFRVVFEPIRELRPQPVWCRLVIDAEKSVNQSSLTRGRRKRLLELEAESRRIFQIS